MQKNTVFESSEQEELLKKAHGAESSAQQDHEGTKKEPLPSIEFLPYVDEAEEKRRFWKTVLITMLVFVAVSSAIIGYVFTQRLSQPSKPKINIQYIDSAPRADVTIKIQVSARPTRAPTAATSLTPLSPIVQATRAPTTRPGGSIPYVVLRTGTPAVIPIKISTPAPTKASSAGQTQPTVTAPVTPLPTVTPTGPAPTPYLYSTSDGTSGISFGYVDPGSSVSSVIQIVNIGGSSLTVSDLAFATTGGTNPYLLSGGGDGSCLTSANLPFTLAVGAGKCISIHFNPSSGTSNTNSLLIRWNTSNIKNVPLLGNATTPTRTPSPTP